MATKMRVFVATSLLACRIAVIAMCSASLASLGGPDSMNYTALRFLVGILSIQLPWSLTRLLYDVAVLIFHAPMPGHRFSVAIIAFELVLSHLTFAAGCSLFATEVYMNRDTGACVLMPSRSCSRYVAAAVLALLAYGFNYAIAILLFCLQASRA